MTAGAGHEGHKKFVYSREKAIPMVEFNDKILSQVGNMNPGDYAVYRIENGRLITMAFSDGLPGLSGLTEDEYAEITKEDAAAIVLEADRRQVSETIGEIIRNQDESSSFSVTYRIFHKQFGFIWVRAKAKMIAIREGAPVILVSFATMAAEAQEYTNLLNSNDMIIYVVDKDTYELLFVNQPALKACGKHKYQNEKCYHFFNGEDSPCPWCSLPSMKDGYSHVDASYVPTRKKWYRKDVYDISWYGHKAAAFYTADITEQKERQEAYEERFSNLYKEIAYANPNALAMFRLNLTKNTCSDVQSTFDTAVKQQAAGTVDGYLAACAEIITDEKIREDCVSRFSLTNLISEFNKGVTEMSIEYPIHGRAGNTIWVNGVIVMIQNSVTDDIEGIAYALNITDQKTSETILARISEEKYDHIGLISPVQHSYELWKQDKSYDLQPHRSVDYDETFRDIIDHYISAEDRRLFEEHGKLESIVSNLNKNGKDTFVYRYIDPNGRCVYKQVNYVWLGSQKDLVLETQTDLTELYEQQIEHVKQQHEAELAKERALSMESIPSGVGVFDVADGKLTLNYINSGFYQMLGILPEDKGRYFSDDMISNVFADDRARLNDAIDISIQEKKQLNCRIRILDGDRKLHWVEIAANHVPMDQDTERFYVSYYDVDQLIRIQDELKEKELTYRDILSYSEIVHFTYYLQQRQYKIEALPEKYHMVPIVMDNYPESFIKLVHLNEKDTDAFLNMVKEIDDGAKESECTVFMSLQGVEGWYRVHLMSVPDEYGHTVKAIGNVFNVDRAKEAEKAISDERFRMRSLCGIYLATACFSVKKDYEIAFNHTGQLEKLEGIDHNALEEARTVEPLVDKQSPETLVTLFSASGQIPDKEQRQDFIRTCSHAGMLREFYKGNRDITLEYRRFVDEKLIWVSTRVILMEEPSTGDILAFYYTRDINEEKQNEQIRKLALEKQSDYMALLDVKSQMLSFRGASHIERTFCRSFDLNGENRYEEGIRTAINGSLDNTEGQALLNDISIAHIIESLENRDEYSVAYDWKDQDGTMLRKQILYQWLEDTKENILIVESDITSAFIMEQQRARQLQNALETTEKANNAKTEFISRISHDVRTPIGAINNMISFAREDIDARDKLLNDLDKIETSNDLLLSLINDVLDISKIDSGKIELHPEPYPYDEYIENIRNIFEPLCQQNGLDFVIEGAETGNGHAVIVDHVRYNQISLNLLSNAVKYTPSGGTITYTSHARKRSDNMVECSFTVADTGIGMSKKFQEKMFEPFSQENDNPARMKPVNGTGLGLSIVKRLVDLMGGKITVKSEVGKGTAISVAFVLPEVDMGKIASEEQGDAVASERLHGRILMAEDNEINTEIAVRILSSFGLTIMHAENGKQAVEIFERSAPDEYQCILMDIQMPVMNGYEATKNIRALDRPDAGRVPIIAMTADVFEESLQAAKQAGMDDYVMKPIDTHRLYKILSKAIRVSSNGRR